MFQSTRPQGARRRPTRSPPSTVCCFNPRARKGRDCSPRARRCRPASFNPRARKGRDKPLTPNSFLLLVSIHAPARGATTGMKFVLDGLQFQSTRPQGARLNHAGRCFLGGDCFNPRARKGRDLAVRGERNQLHPVSIHAPARGATIFDLSSDQAALVSIHAPARGATRWYTKAPARRDSFNPRARKGRDDWMVSDVAAWFQFQSTRPQGARPRGDAEIRVAVDVSIHAPARGATALVDGLNKYYEFQSTRPQGARLLTSAYHPMSACFNPRARKGRDSF